MTVLLLLQFKFLTSFSSLITMARISNTMLNKSVQSGHSCLVPVLKEALSAFHHWIWCWLYVCHAIVVQSVSCVWLFVTPWTAACQAYLSFAISWSLLKLMSIESSVIYGLYYVEVCLLIPILLRVFNHKWMLNSVKIFSVSMNEFYYSIC